MYSSLLRMPLPRFGLPWIVLGFQSVPWGPSDALLVQGLGDLLWRHSSRIVAEDPAYDGCLLLLDLAFARGHDAALESPQNPVAVAQTAAGSAGLDTPAEAATGLIRELLEEHRVHRALESDVQKRDVVFRESDDADAREREPLEQAGRFFLVAAEAVE
jgi:hypothetical protein